ncbi:hypothetical protein DSM07_10360 [Oenococcus sp. UCMA 16435]|nr:hypothetical protein [Oenococcus sp. UCMA 14587]QHW12469.1 hypothetical protein DSM07_10360 [Oenococcus sp. UCMA 16435]
MKKKKNKKIKTASVEIIEKAKNRLSKKLKSNNRKNNFTENSDKEKNS